MIILFLTCADSKEAKTIIDALLKAKLIACARTSNVSSSYWWNQEIEQTQEVLLTMESRKDKFEAIESVVAKLHSYDQFVLTAVNIHKASGGVEDWLSESLD